MLSIDLDQARCNGCGLCADFCPVSVFDMQRVDDRVLPLPARLEDCWACDTCVGQCPTGALRVVQPGKSAAVTDAGEEPSHMSRLLPEQVHECKDWSDSLERVLRLRWKPVAVSLISKNTTLPSVPKPRVKLRYCQSLMAARRGKSLLMTADCHACPDGTSILGLTEIPPKLASGELYIKFGKMASLQAARQMVEERPKLDARSIQATLATPLAKPILLPHVVVIVAQPEQMMWLCMAASFNTGKRFNFKVSGYNAQCVETTLIPYTSGQINISLGCYGCRASTDVGDDLMFMGVPFGEMASLVSGLEKLGAKAIPDSRAKIYLPPLI
jgi:uncharacterized protein (DUF169 family)/NAD-dependent dihydropyrimidine dehydrogenase PreA subunit